jgi:hypothetical protein
MLQIRIPSNSNIPTARNSIAKAGTLLVKGIGKGKALRAAHQATQNPISRRDRP